MLAPLFVAPARPLTRNTAMPDSGVILTPKYRRVLLKLSGEALGYGGNKLGINLDETKAIAEQMKARPRARRPAGDRSRRRQSASRRAVHGWWRNDQVRDR